MLACLVGSSLDHLSDQHGSEHRHQQWAYLCRDQLNHKQMGASITFNVDKLIKQLDIIQKSHLPKASEQALKSLGFDLRQVLQDKMRREYGNPSADTLGSRSSTKTA